jgi:hypothetical protein
VLAAASRVQHRREFRKFAKRTHEEALSQGPGTIEARLGIRRSLLKVGADHLRRLVARLERTEICAPETYHKLFRTP